MYQESYPYRVLFFTPPKHTISCCNNYNHVFGQTKKEGLSWAIMFSRYGRNRRLMIFYFACDGIKMWNVTFVLGFQHNDTFKQQHPNFDELVKLYEKDVVKHATSYSNQLVKLN